MNYNIICNAINASGSKGIHEFDQSRIAKDTDINIKNGVCRALVIMWLKAKKQNLEFWKDKGENVTNLPEEYILLSQAVNVQEEYQRAVKLSTRFAPDEATLDKLKKAGLAYSQDDVLASAQEGFAENRIINEPAKISEHILNSKSRFYILSASGPRGCHSIGIHRPYSLIGKSKNIYIFDPNIGEFEATTSSNVKDLLITINTLGYGANVIDGGYILWSYHD
ncbi:virulence surface antigen [Clostridium cavendishii DSM 21758]|uniref:Virulence surface antigen n=1 Tax=Clostridium cavendishii DSM 21758 TaxID=1121302 RepID=A0A1M6NBI6_9CLOT|nr:YopT-type cysteine protease domain-containing protein [Clostridium cavendishii]SHJ93075.1 virulence surface antigen [Clostridium cavendishii DSM 21758]